MSDGGTLTFETENVTLDEAFTTIHIGAKPGRYALLTVSDTGHGMDKETMGKIFEPFFTTKEQGKGTGLGLSSVYGIVESHGGYISCYSEIGQGTIFKIYLPAIEHVDFNEDKSLESKSLQGGTETILLVDDEEAIRGLAFELLETFGYTVLTATNGEEALNVYNSHSNEIGLVILDISMPGMGGHLCLQELIQLDPAVKVLVSSGYSINGRVENCLEAGAVGYLGKPYNVNNLLEKVRAILDEENKVYSS